MDMTMLDFFFLFLSFSFTVSFSICCKTKGFVCRLSHEKMPFIVCLCVCVYCVCMCILVHRLKMGLFMDMDVASILRTILVAVHWASRGKVYNRIAKIQSETNVKLSSLWLVRFISLSLFSLTFFPFSLSFQLSDFSIFFL